MHGTPGFPDACRQLPGRELTQPRDHRVSGGGCQDQVEVADARHHVDACMGCELGEDRLEAIGDQRLVIGSDQHPRGLAQRAEIRAIVARREARHQPVGIGEGLGARAVRLRKIEVEYGDSIERGDAGLVQQAEQDDPAELRVRPAARARARRRRVVLEERRQQQIAIDCVTRGATGDAHRESCS